MGETGTCLGQPLRPCVRLRSISKFRIVTQFSTGGHAV